MSAPDLIVRGRKVIAGDASRAASPAAIFIRGGLIESIGPYGEIPSGCPVDDAGDLIVMPGVVDTHVHINEPGRTEWEGFATVTRAAAAGGVTTLIEMPLNSIPATTSFGAYREKLASAAGKLCVDVGFWGGVVPGNAEELSGLWEEGVFGFKCFLVPSGVDEFRDVSRGDLCVALPRLVELGAPLLVHAEDPGVIERAARATAGVARNQYSSWLASRPRGAETDAIVMMMGLSREFGARVHIVHVSSSDALEMIRAEKRVRGGVTAETCPHYLAFAAEEIPDGATEFKCGPPIRERDNAALLWDALDDGTLDLIASDHSPCPPEMKHAESGDFFAAWGGIASLELSLAAVWTSARERGYAVERLAGWMCDGPARLAGLEKRKGCIAAGYDADFVIWDPEGKFRVDGRRLQQRHKLTPYDGRELYGVVASTYLRGRKIFERGNFLTGPTGTILRRAH
jgi:allantoinase